MNLNLLDPKLIVLAVAVILIIAAGGAFKQVLVDSGTGDAIKDIAAHAQLSPILLAWATKKLLRQWLAAPSAQS